MPFPSPGYLPNTGIEPGFPALQADSLPTKYARLFVNSDKFIDKFGRISILKILSFPAHKHGTSIQIMFKHFLSVDLSTEVLNMAFFKSSI